MSNYAKDLPAKLGNTEIFRAIYDKIGSDTPSSEKVVEKLDDISHQLGNVNDNLSNVNITLDVHTQALENINKSIQNASLNTNVTVNNKIIIDTSNLPGKDDMQKIVNSIDSVANSTADGFNKVSAKANKIANVNKQGFNKVADNVNKLADVNKQGFEGVTRAIQQSKPVPPEPPFPPYPPVPPCPPHPHPCPEPVTPCDKIIPSYREGQRCKECEKQNQITEGLSTNYDKHYRRCQEPQTLEGLYEAYYHCYYPTFDDFFQALYGAQEDYYGFRDRYYAERYDQQYNENYDYYA